MSDATIESSVRQFDPSQEAWLQQQHKRTRFFARLRHMTDAEFVEAVRDFNEEREQWMTSALAGQQLDREFRCRELLRRATP